MFLESCIIFFPHSLSKFVSIFPHNSIILYEMMAMCNQAFLQISLNGIVFLLLFVSTIQVDFHSNFNSSKISDITNGDPVSLPILLRSKQQKHYNIPLESTFFSKERNINENEESKEQKLRRYELKDTKYHPDEHSLSQLESSILYAIEPPQPLFDVGKIITIQDYQFLEMKSIKIMMNNPTDKFKFCINEIYADSESITRIQQRKLPFCINSNHKYPFFFNLYITEQKPIIYRASIYFIVSIYDGNEFVEEKIWPRQIIVKVSQNHLKLSPLEAKGCSNPKNQSMQLAINNPHPHAIKINIENESDLHQKIAKQISIPSLKTFKMQIPSKKSTFIITTKVHDGYINEGVRFPKILLPVHCVPPLIIDPFNIGVINVDRSILEILIPVSSTTKQLIQIKGVKVMSSTETVQISNIGDQEVFIKPEQNSQVICRLLAHIPKQHVQKTLINVTVLYVIQSNLKEIVQAKLTYKYYEVRNPLSLGGRRFIDVSKGQDSEPVFNKMFPIRNNLNLPLLLIRVVYDENTFKLTWARDRRQYIYPNQNREQFSLQYIGPRQIPISPIKYIITLEFNGNLLIPIQIVIYDHSLQCVYNNIQQKCQNLGPIDYGYFKGNNTKIKQLVIRNWNPVQKEIRIKTFKNLIDKFGMNYTINIFGPFPAYQFVPRYAKEEIILFLKGNHFLILSIALTPLSNYTSGETQLLIYTVHQIINKTIKFKVENGTFALLPQIIRLPNAYFDQVEYLNLVSTFSESYRIKNIYVNNSNFKINYNFTGDIHVNQWVGLLLYYEAFSSNNIVGTSRLNLNSPSPDRLAQSISTVQPHRSTDNCCGNQYFMSNFINPLLHNDFKRYSYYSIKAISTTDLQATSVIIIDNTPPKIIQVENITLSLLKHNKQYLSICQSSSLENGKSHNAEGRKKDYIIQIKNIFNQSLKYKPVLIPKYLYQDTKQFISTVRRTKKTYEDALFCVNNLVSSKQNVSPQMVKALLSLDSVPQQLTIEPLENQQYYIGGTLNKRNTIDNQNSPYLTTYVRRAVGNGARICYKMNVTKYIKQLIQTNILNDLAENHSSQVFHQFVEKQIQFYNSGTHYLEYDQFYQNLGLKYQKYCNKSLYTFFRFCKQVGVKIFPKSETILPPSASADITLKVAVNFQQNSQSFYFVLLNNITRYQAHLVQINITEPKLKISKIYNSTTDIEKSPKNTNQLVSKLSKKDLAHIIKIRQSRNLENEINRRKFFSSSLFVIFSGSQYHSEKEIIRTFTLSNIGSIDVEITHVGFQNYEKICQYEGIQILREGCDGFKIEKGSQKNISIKLSKEKYNNWSGVSIVSLYFYNAQSYFLKTQLIIKGVQLKSEHEAVSDVFRKFIHAISLAYVIVIIFRVKMEVSRNQNSKIESSKQKIMHRSNYIELGVRIQKRMRKVESISDDQIFLVKQIQQSRLKQFFNSSDESEIANRQCDEDQPSNNQILNALKQNHHNVSVSQESSVDFIDLNTLNKSKQHNEDNDSQKEPRSQQNYEQQIDVEGEGSSEIDEEGHHEIDAVSNFNEGDEGEEIDDWDGKGDYGWSQPNQYEKKVQQGKYYNVFTSQNPLMKKKESDSLFHWMNEKQKTHNW